MFMLFFILINCISFAQAQHQFEIDFSKVKHDAVTVKCKIKKIYGDSVDFNFPMTVPGTYDILNYGKYISDFKAINQNNQDLKYKKLGYNTFRIYQAQGLQEISYKVHDTFDTLVKENKIFEPAGTDIQEGKHLLINGGGFIGFFQNEENQPFNVKLTYPDSMEAFSAYESVLINDATKSKSRIYNFRNYHEWIDHPIMVCTPDTAEFFVNQTRVTIACFHEKGKKVAQETKSQIEKSLQAIGKFLSKLPVDRYVFLIYLKDFENEMQVLRKRGSIFKKIKLLFRLQGMGFGALEHGTSSVYYLFDGGNQEFIYELQRVAIHEFLHIVTPLSLHTEPIGNFNYIKPIFSKHLWLYEGSTEYHAGIIQIQNKLLNFEQYFKEYVENKLMDARNFPIKKMSIAEMSENVMLPQYQKQYLHVYDLGALLCMALDIEIISLTEGKKTLKSVILELLEKYGKNQNAPENNLISEFVQLVHPDLQKFFDKHILGHEYPDFEQYLKKVGVIYEREKYPLIPVVIQNGEIKKIKNRDYQAFRLGDKVTRQAINEACYNHQGNLLADGQLTKVQVERNGKLEWVEFKVKTQLGEYTFQKNPQATDKELKFRKIWIGE